MSMLEPQELVPAIKLSSKTLKEMDTAIRNFKAGTVSEPVDLSEFEKE